MLVLLLMLLAGLHAVISLSIYFSHFCVVRINVCNKITACGRIDIYDPPRKVEGA